MSWRIRHQGSPQAVENLSLAQIVAGLRDDQWDASDEVMGPAERRWTPIETHPRLAEVAIEIDEARDRVVPAEDPEEQRIDMNPLIDVCLVLLVFFILATSLSVLERVLDVPSSRADRPSAPVRTKEQLRETSIYVKAFKGDGRTIIDINGNEVLAANLQANLEACVREGRRTELVIDAQGVEWETVVAIIDAAGGAGIRRVQFLVKPR